MWNKRKEERVLNNCKWDKHTQSPLCLCYVARLSDWLRFNNTLHCLNFKDQCTFSNIYRTIWYFTVLSILNIYFSFFRFLQFLYFVFINYSIITLSLLQYFFLFIIYFSFFPLNFFIFKQFFIDFTETIHVLIFLLCRSYTYAHTSS